VASAEVNLPAWMKTVEQIYPNAIKMFSSKLPKQQLIAIPLLTTLLCVSRKDFFHKKLPDFLDLCYPRLRDKAQPRLLIMNSLVRLIWVKFFRSAEPTTSSSSLRQLETIIRVIFPSYRKGVTASETPLDIFVQIVYFICVKHLEYGLDSLILGCLIGVDSIVVTKSNNFGKPSGHHTLGSISLSGTLGPRSLSSTLVSDEGNKYSTFTTTNSPILPRVSNAQISQAFIAAVSGNNILNNMERLVIAVRVIVLILADTYDALAPSLTSPPFGVPLSSDTRIFTSTMTSGVVVEVKINIPTPPFPAQSTKQSTNAKLLTIDSLTKIRERVPHGSGLPAVPGTSGSSNGSNGGGLFGEAPFKPNSSSPIPNIPGTTNQPLKKNDPINDLVSTISEVAISRMPASIRESFDRMREVILRVIQTLDPSIGSWLVHIEGSLYTPVSLLSIPPETSSGERSRGRHTDLPVTELERSLYENMSESGMMVDTPHEKALERAEKFANGRERQMRFELLRTCIDSFPRFVPVNTPMGPAKIIEFLAKYSLHADVGLRTSSLAALQRIAVVKEFKNSFWSPIGIRMQSDSNGYVSIAVGVAKIFMDTVVEILQEHMSEFLINAPWENVELILVDILVVYHSLLNIWKDQLEEDQERLSKEIENSTDLKLSWMNPTLPLVDETEVKTLIDEIESRGLLFLSSLSPKTRKISVQILKFVSDFEEMIGRILEDTSSVMIRESLEQPSIDQVRYSTFLNTSILKSSTLKQNETRLWNIMESCGTEIFSKYYVDSVSSVREEKQHKKQDNSQKIRTLQGVAESESISDKSLWALCFPEFLKECVTFAFTKMIQLTISDICKRITNLHQIVFNNSSNEVVPNGIGSPKSKDAAPPSGNGHKNAKKIPEELVEYWKIYLVFACVMIESLPMNSVSKEQFETFSKKHNRSESHQSQSQSHLILSSKQLFRLALPLLASDRGSIRQATAFALGKMHVSAYFSFLTEIQPYLRLCIDIMRSKTTTNSQNKVIQDTYSIILPGIGNLSQGVDLGNRKLKRIPREIMYVLGFVANFIEIQECRGQKEPSKLCLSIIEFVEETMKFLKHPEICNEWEHQMLRYYLCGFVEHFYDRLTSSVGILIARNPNAVIFIKGGRPISLDRSMKETDSETSQLYFPFSLRIKLFKLFEIWSGYGRNLRANREQQERIVAMLLDSARDQRERADYESNIEEQRKGLESASLRAMASLLKGPLFDPLLNSIETSISHAHLLPVTEKRQTIERSSLEKTQSLLVVRHRSATPESVKTPDEFDLPSIITWIDSLFASGDEKLHKISRTAMEALLTYSGSDKSLLIAILRQCYIGTSRIYTSQTVDGNPVLSSAHQLQVTRGYFLSLVDIIVRNLTDIKTDDEISPSIQEAIGWKRFHFEPHWLLCLALFKCGDPNLHVRKGAVKLLRVVEKEFFGPILDDALNLNRDPQTMDIIVPNQEDDQRAEVYEQAAITSTLPIVYKYAQAIISARFAAERAEWSLEMFSEMVMRIEMIQQKGDVSGYPQGIRDMLTFMVPWIHNIELSLLADMDDTSSKNTSNASVHTRGSGPDKSFSRKSTLISSILINLFYLTITFGDDYVTEVENLWVQLVESKEEMFLDSGEVDEQSIKRIGEKNMNIIVMFLLDVGVTKRNPKFIPHAKKVMVYLSRTRAGFELIEAVMARISPKSLVPNNTDANNDSVTSFGLVSRNSEKFDTEQRGLYTADINKFLVDSGKRPVFSKGQLACVLLVDLAIEVGSSSLRPHLPLLIHAAFVQLDHFIPLICEQSRLLLLYLLQSTISLQSLGNGTLGEVGSNLTGRVTPLIKPLNFRNRESYELRIRYEALQNSLSLKEGKKLWTYEDVYPNKSRNLQSVKHLSSLVLEVNDIINNVGEDVVQLWGKTALDWGVNCPVRHIACRSLQVFRTLMPTFTPPMLGDLIFRLSNTIGDQMSEVQGYALEILITLHAVFDGLSPERVLLFPQFFWAGVACLNSPHEWEYIEGVHLLTKFIKKIDVNENGARDIIFNALPQKWKHKFVGLQPLLLRGLQSSKAEGPSLSLINLLVPFEIDGLVDENPARRLLCSVLANLTRMMQGFEIDPSTDGGSEVGLTTEQCLEIAGNLAESSKIKDYPSLARLLLAYSKQKFRSKEDFLRQLVQIIKEFFFPLYEHATLDFMMGLLSNSLPFYRRRALRALKQLLPVFNPATDAELANYFSMEQDLILPLIDLLPTDLGEEAIDVLDAAVKGSITQSNNLTLIMGPKKFRSIIKEASNLPEIATKSDDTGWRVSDVEKSLKNTRYNMAAVSFTCIAGGGRGTRAPTFNSSDLRVSFPQVDISVLEALDALSKFFEGSGDSSATENIASDDSAGFFDNTKVSDNHTKQEVYDRQISDRMRNDSVSSLGVYSNARRHSEEVTEDISSLKSPTLNRSYTVPANSENLRKSHRNRLHSNEAINEEQSDEKIPSPIRKILLNPDSSVFVIFRMNISLDEMSDHFKDQLRTDISRALSLDPRRISLEKFEQDTSIFENELVETEDADGTFVTVKIVHNPNENNPDKLIELAEKLLRILASLQTDRLDHSWNAEILIGYTGMLIPFSYYKTSRTSSRHHNPKRTHRDIPPIPDNIILEDAVDLLQIFSASISFSHDLFSDWVGKVEQYFSFKRQDVRFAEGGKLGHLYRKILGLFRDSKFLLILEASRGLDLSQRLLNHQQKLKTLWQSNPSFLRSFLINRAKLTNNFNMNIAEYLELRNAEEIDIKNDVGFNVTFEKLAVILLGLYLSAINLQELLDDLDVSKEPRILEMRA
ncbi:Cell morphogenesis protein PAG1, partial [Nowakowskiella sp. JEL0078]